MMDINNHRLLSIVSGGDSEEFDNYIATTTDPGNTLLIIAAFICLVSLVGLPLYVLFPENSATKCPTLYVSIIISI